MENRPSVPHMVLTIQCTTDLPNHISLKLGYCCNALELTLRPKPDPRQLKQPRTGVPARPTLMQLRTEA